MLLTISACMFLRVFDARGLLVLRIDNPMGHHVTLGSRIGFADKFKYLIYADKRIREPCKESEERLLPRAALVKHFPQRFPKGLPERLQ